MPRSSGARAPQLLGLRSGAREPQLLEPVCRGRRGARAWTPCSAARGANAGGSGPRSLRLQGTRAQPGHSGKTQRSQK